MLIIQKILHNFIKLIFIYQHVHLHILPCKKNDFVRNEEIYEKFSEHDRDMSTGLRTNEALVNEAAEYRKFFGYP